MPETRLITFNIELGILAITHEVDLVFNGIVIPTTNPKLRTFLKGISCVDCGAEGEFFAVDITYDNGTPVYHLNLYTTKDGKEELMTSDHIRPKSKGGKGGLTNRQPMCRPCNLAKGNNMV